MIPIGRVSPEAMVLTPPVWDDLRVPANATGVGAANAPTFQKNFDDGAGSVGLFQQSFAAGARNDVFFEMQLSHGYEEGSDILLHAHYLLLNNNVGNIIWELEYLYGNIGSDFASPTTLLTPITVATPGAAGRHMSTDLVTLPGGGGLPGHSMISAFIIGRLSRLGNDGADTYTGECALLGIDAHIRVNTLGSELERLKFK
jgi:hypothetical protein